MLVRGNFRVKVEDNYVFVWFGFIFLKGSSLCLPSSAQLPFPLPLKQIQLNCVSPVLFFGTALVCFLDMVPFRFCRGGRVYGWVRLFRDYAVFIRSFSVYVHTSLFLLQTLARVLVSVHVFVLWKQPVEALTWCCL